jgi:hypothetical protein
MRSTPKGRASPLCRARGATTPSRLVSPRTASRLDSRGALAMIDRQREGEGGAPSYLALHPDPAAMHLDELLAEGESEAGASCRASSPPTWRNSSWDRGGAVVDPTRITSYRVPLPPRTNRACGLSAASPAMLSTGSSRSGCPGPKRCLPLRERSGHGSGRRFWSL